MRLLVKIVGQDIGTDHAAETWASSKFGDGGVDILQYTLSVQQTS